jgi:hypothetical protein
VIIVRAMGLGEYSESTEKRRLSGLSERRGSRTGLSTPAMFAFSLPFVGVGIFATLAGTKIVHGNPSSVHSPYFIQAAFGLVFAIAGLTLWNMAWRQFRSNRHRALALKQHASEPALEDYDWEPRGFRSHCWARANRHSSLYENGEYGKRAGWPNDMN